MSGKSAAGLAKGRDDNKPRRFKLYLGVLGVLATVIAGWPIAGAQGQYTTPPASVAEAKQLVATYEKPSVFTAPGPSFDAMKAKGKKVFFMGVVMSIPFVSAVANGFTAAMSPVGVSVVISDAKGQISEAARGIAQAVSQKVDAIVDDGVDEALLRPALADAKKAGIPVIDFLAFDPGPLPSGISPAIVAGGGHCYACAGRMMADSIIADSNGKAHVVIVTASDIGLPQRNEIEGSASEFKRLCPGCKLSYVDVKSGQWNTLTSLTPDILRRDPSVDYLSPLFDGQALFMVPAVHVVGAQSRVKIVSFNGTPAILKSLQGGDVVVADVGTPNEWEGWAAADQTLRVLTSTSPVLDTKIPERLFTRANIGSIDLKADQSTWYNADFKTGYKTLWNVK
jgi:ribose transport system substrate-binding protein